MAGPRCSLASAVTFFNDDQSLFVNPKSDVRSENLVLLKDVERQNCSDAYIRCVDKLADSQIHRN